MAEHTKISWCDATFNPVIGCSKVSAGCANCYAERDFDHHRHWVQWGPQGTRAMTGDRNWQMPGRLNERAARERPESLLLRPKVFCASLSDVFEDWQGSLQDAHGTEIRRCERCERLFPGSGDNPACRHCQPARTSVMATMGDVRARLWQLMQLTPNLDWLLLTKRPQNVRWMVPASWLSNWPPHIWIGTTAENQPALNTRMSWLLEIPARVRFLSCEPLLEDLDLNGPFDAWCRAYRGTATAAVPRLRDHLHWVIAGGESGPQARVMDPAWPRALRDQCQAAGVPYCFKQWGEGSLGCGLKGHPLYEAGYAAGAKHGGDLLDGRQWHEFPVSLEEA